jgi:rhodanese-related sulfurtransferase
MAMKAKLPDPKKARAYFQARVSFSIGPMELSKLMTEGRQINLFDVRSAERYREGHIPGAISLPREDWAKSKALKKTMLNVMYCSSMVCHAAPEAALHFSARGYPVMEMDGGFEEWRDQGLAVEVTPEITASEPVMAPMSQDGVMEAHA